MSEPSIRAWLNERLAGPNGATAFQMVEILYSAWEECHRELMSGRAQTLALREALAEAEQGTDFALASMAGPCPRCGRRIENR